MLIERQTPWRLIVFSVTLAGAVLIRPAGLSLLVGVPLLLALERVAVRQVVALVLAPVSVVWLSAATINLMRSGVFTLQEMGGISLAGHVAALAPDDVRTAHPEISAQILGSCGPGEKRRGPWVGPMSISNSRPSSTTP